MRCTILCNCAILNVNDWRSHRKYRYMYDVCICWLLLKCYSYRNWIGFGTRFGRYCVFFFTSNILIGFNFYVHRVIEFLGFSFHQWHLPFHSFTWLFVCFIEWIRQRIIWPNEESIERKFIRSHIETFEPSIIHHASYTYTIYG